MAIHKDKRHWYDGKLYSMFIDPSTEDTRKIISSLIERNSNVIDIGFGTGSLAFYLSKKCKYVLGIELSKRMVNYANSLKLENNISNIHFLHGDAEKVSELTNEIFDYAIFSLSLHEMESDTRIKTLEEIKKVTDNIIVYDYLVKGYFSFQGLINMIVEFLAGKDHFDNCRTFLKEGGIYGLLEKSGFKVEKNIIDKGSFVAVKARWK